ncbi:ParA family protein [Candidatus Nesciobacter abundans]|uniref:Chromosome partitioning protein ParA n=1 Tax=Candidatus Nesciobacter abundans TaxID=2601668 RepID=A0A5C0UGS7_9PROT|nr:ParA family protein [Candidatus Nesciobacter abundans]
MAVVNQKGGVGKTTTAVNLSTALAQKGKKVLLIDLDPQGNATTGVGLEKNSVSNSYDLFFEKVQESKTFVENLHCIPSSKDLAGIAIELASDPVKNYKLKQSINYPEYDYIIMDSPPTLGLISLNILNACNGIIIPMQCEFYSLEGIAQLMETISSVRENWNKDIKIDGILMTMFDRRNMLSKDVLNEVTMFFKDLVFETKIPRNVKLAEAPSFGKPGVIYSPLSPGAKAYDDLAEEFLSKEKLNQ